MTLDEAIKHAEKVAEKNEKKAKSYPKPDKNVKGSGRKYNDCIECASEHRQLAEWLKDYKRLLKQEPKTGRWIFVDKAHEHAHCSECDYGNVDLLNGRPHNYCTNCGRCMVGHRKARIRNDKNNV